MAKRKSENQKVVGHHRSRALAKKHLKSLGKGWKIESRRRKNGHYSTRGHTFIFIKEEEKLQEWMVTWEYDGSIANRTLDFYVVASSEKQAFELVMGRVSRGKDDLGYDLKWAKGISWDRNLIIKFEHDPGEKKEPLIGERVEVH